MFNEFVVSTRIRAARNVSGYALPAGTDDKVPVYPRIDQSKSRAIIVRHQEAVRAHAS